MDAAFVLYDNMTALDLIGPYEVLAGSRQVTPCFVADQAGPIRCDSGATLHADLSFGELHGADIIVVPGSSHWRAALEHEALIAWLAGAYPRATWTTSVCTGSTLLAKAGILTGRPATTHWAVRDVLAAHGAVVSEDRVVRDGDVITCAGVSAGIDMALSLAAVLWGDTVARGVQLAIEYDPQPPFDSGSPDSAPPEVVAVVRSLLTGA